MVTIVNAAPTVITGHEPGSSGMSPFITVNKGLPTEIEIPWEGKSAIKTTEEKLGIHGDTPTKDQAVSILEKIDNMYTLGATAIDISEYINALRLYIDTSTPLLCEDEGCDHAGTKHVCTNNQFMRRGATAMEIEGERDAEHGTVIGLVTTLAGDKYYVFECDHPIYMMFFVLPKHLKFDDQCDNEPTQSGHRKATLFGTRGNTPLLSNHGTVIGEATTVGGTACVVFEHDEPAGMVIGYPAGGVEYDEPDSFDKLRQDTAELQAKADMFFPITPVLRATGGPDDNCHLFMENLSTKFISHFTTGNVMGATAPLRIGAAINLIGISEMEALIQNGVMARTDTLDFALYIKAIYIEFDYNNGMHTSIEKFDVSQYPTMAFRYAPEKRTVSMAMNSDSNIAITIHPDVKLFDEGSLLRHLSLPSNEFYAGSIVLGPHPGDELKLDIKVALTGIAHIETAELCVHAGDVIMTLYKDDNTPVDSKTIQPPITARVVAYDIHASRVKAVNKYPAKLVQRSPLPIKVMPVYKSSRDEAFIKDLPPRFSTQFETKYGDELLSAPLVTGNTHDLLSLSNVDSLLINGQMGVTDILADNAYIEKMYIEFIDDIDRDVVPFALDKFTAIGFNDFINGDVNDKILNPSGIIIGGVLPLDDILECGVLCRLFAALHYDAADVNIIISMTPTGRLQLRHATVYVQFENLLLTFVDKNSGKRLSNSRQTDTALITPQFKAIPIGFDISAFRIPPDA